MTITATGNGARGVEGPGARSANQSDLLHVLESAETLSKVHTIDSILEGRNRAPIAEDVPTRDIEPNDLRRTGPVLGQTTMNSGGPATEADFAKVHVDIYGRPPPGVALREERISALEDEIQKIPEAKRRSLKKALRHYPLLYSSSAHAKLIIEDENFDPKDAARRLAQYWEYRVDMFGSRAFSEGVFTAPTYHDYLRFYEQCARISNDQDADSEKRQIASEYIRCVHNTKIAAMDRIIDDSASPDDKAAFLEAQTKCPEVAASDDMKLHFLRCEDFVELRAAERMLRYWKAKREFFGPDVFHRRIALADMESHIFDREHFRTFRLMPEPDAHGRIILVASPCDFMQEGWTELGAGKYMFYLVDYMLENVECQQNGFVIFVDYRHSSDNVLHRIANYRNIGRTIILNSAPVNLRAIHVWFRPDSWWQQLFANSFNRLRGFITSRVVIHAGTAEESMRTLEEEFNISRDAVPIELGGNVRGDEWKDQLETRRSNDL